MKKGKYQDGSIIKEWGYAMKKSKTDISAITTTVVEEIMELLNTDVYKIVLYGSYAREDFTSESDIDIMIILNCEKEKVFGYRKQISRIASRIGLENDIEVSLLLRDRNTFEEGMKVLPFYKNIYREGIALYG